MASRMTRKLFVSLAARRLVDGINAGAIERAHCTPARIEENLRVFPGAFETLAKVTGYDNSSLTDGQRVSLARAISSAVSNHPNLREV